MKGSDTVVQYKDTASKQPDTNKTMNWRRILIVDDNNSVHDDIHSILKYSVSEEQDELMEIERELFGEIISVNSNRAIDSYIIDDAYQGEEAICMVQKAAMEERPYTVIFMDIRMPPGLDGITTIKKIWENHPFVEIVVITAYSDYSWDEILKELGVTDQLLFLRKPFDSVSIKQVALSLTVKWDLSNKNRQRIENLEDIISERTTELNTLINEKERYIHRINEDLELARLVQHRLLPKTLPEFADLEVASIYLPASKVGGDFYHIIPIDSKKAAFIIFDVSGHGLAAALITAVGRATFDLYIKEKKTESPSEILTMVNRDIFNCTPDTMFFTTFLMIVNFETNRATYANAGHVPPLLYKKSQGTFEALNLRDKLLGIFEDTTYTEGVTQIEPGDKIVLYTDGLTEAFDREKNAYGIGKLMQAFAANASLPCDTIVENIIKDNTQFIKGAPRIDDVCLLVAKFK